VNNLHAVLTVANLVADQRSLFGWNS